MSKKNANIRPKTLFWGIALLLVLLADVFAADPQVKLGEYGPDFELPILTLGTDDSGKPIGRINDSKTIKLSSYYGKKPVCLIMSSYT